MESFFDWLIANPWSLIAVSVIIFLVTLVLIFKRIFNFVITMILLVICLVAGYSIINPDLALNFIKEYRSGKLNSENSKAMLDHAIDDLKGKFEGWKDKVPPATKP